MKKDVTTLLVLVAILLIAFTTTLSAQTMIIDLKGENVKVDESGQILPSEIPRLEALVASQIESQQAGTFICSSCGHSGQPQVKVKISQQKISQIMESNLPDDLKNEIVQLLLASSE